MKKEYFIIVSGDAKKVEESVEHLSSQGWQMQGGISIAIAPDNKTMAYAQAMIRTIKPEKKKKR